MAIAKNSFKVSRFDLEFSSRSGETMSSVDDDDDELQRQSSAAIESNEDDEFNECDSGAGSDDFDMLELGKTGEEFCQVGDQTCTIPFELYDLSSLVDVLSMNVWNDCLTEEEQFNLTKYLPDMDQDDFMLTMKELFTGHNFHFGSPINKLYDMLKGGLCEPRVALYRQGLNFLQKRKYYHFLQKHQNSMVTNLCRMRNAWVSCRGYSVEEKLRVLNIMKSQKSLMYEKMEELETNSTDKEESGEDFWSQKLKDRKIGQKILTPASPNFDFPSRGKSTFLETEKYGKKNPKGTLKFAGSKASSNKEFIGLEMKSGLYGSAWAPHRQNKAAFGYGGGEAIHVRDQLGGGDDVKGTMYEVDVQSDRNFSRVSAMDKTQDFKKGKKHGNLRGDQNSADSFVSSPLSLKTDLYAYGRNKTVNQLSDVEVLTAKPSNTRILHGYGEKVIYDPSFQHGDGKSKKWKMGRESPNLKIKDGLFLSDYGGKPLQDKVRASSKQNGGFTKFAKSEETKSDSSEQIEEDEDDNSLMRSKFAYPSGILESNPPIAKSGPDPNKGKFGKKDKKYSSQTFDRLPHSSRKMADLGEHVHLPELQNYPLQANQKGKNHDKGHLHSSASRVLENHCLSGSARFSGDNGWKKKFLMGKNGPMKGLHGKKFNTREYSVSQTNYLHDYNVGEEDDSLETRQLAEENGVVGRLGISSQVTEAYLDDRYDNSGIPLLGPFKEKRKVKDDVTYLDERGTKDILPSNPHHDLDEITSSKKRGKRKLEDESSAIHILALDPPLPEMGTIDIGIESKSQKKPFTLITPTVHTGFSFSIIHLLSAVRMAMITLLPEDTLDVGKNLDKNESFNGDLLQENLDTKDSDHSGQVNVPSLTVQEIINRIRSNPGDPCILETQEPLQDLVRGVLRIFSSKTAPLGAKGWKSLVIYQKSTKTWSWVSPPRNSSSSDHDAIEEVTSPDFWDLPHKMLVKLVDSFANWLKSGQETLKQMGSLPAPPLMLTQFNLDEKERFRDLKAQKSLTTISPSSEEVRAYFRKEEVLRYSIPDRAFSYTALDGKKSIVAALRRCGGKSTSKARDHFMLKRDRPPHVTILCLVRDAAARLPGNIGTRADVCALIRDSQYIVEEVPDTQVNQVVSGALDRLHYERDPCVQFDGERKLWVYLHRDREEEDFEDDGTSSTKKWKRQKKEVVEPLDLGTVTVAYRGAEEQSGLDLSPDLNNVGPSGMDEDSKLEFVFNDGGHDRWGDLDLNPMQGNKLPCQENSMSEDFDDEVFGREPRSEFLGASLS